MSSCVVNFGLSAGRRANPGSNEEWQGSIPQSNSSLGRGHVWESREPKRRVLPSISPALRSCRSCSRGCRAATPSRFFHLLAACCTALPSYPLPPFLPGHGLRPGSRGGSKTVPAGRRRRQRRGGCRRAGGAARSLPQGGRVPSVGAPLCCRLSFRSGSSRVWHAWRCLPSPCPSPAAVAVGDAQAVFGGLEGRTQGCWEACLPLFSPFEARLRRRLQAHAALPRGRCPAAARR